MSEQLSEQFKNRIEGGMNEKTSADMEKKHLRHINPEELKEVYRQSEHERKKRQADAFAEKTIEGQAPERRDNAIYGEDWCNHLNPEAHSNKSIYAIHGVGTKGFDITGDVIDVKLLRSYCESGFPDEVEICASLVEKGSGNFKRKAFRAVGFVIMPQYITRFFYQDIGSEKRGAGIRGVSENEDYPQEKVEYFGNAPEEYLQKTKERLEKEARIDEHSNLVASFSFKDCLLALPEFCKTIESYSPAQKELIGDFLWEVSGKKMTYSYPEIKKALKDFYQLNGVREQTTRANLSYIKFGALIEELYKRFKDPHSFDYTEVPTGMQKAFVEVNETFRMYNEMFVVNPKIEGLYIRSLEDLKQYALSLNKLRNLFPNLPTLVLETWQLFPSRNSEYIGEIGFTE